MEWKQEVYGEFVRFRGMITSLMANKQELKLGFVGIRVDAYMGTSRDSGPSPQVLHRDHEGIMGVPIKCYIGGILRNAHLRFAS